jgi:Mor family transcriptional regulator
VFRDLVETIADWISSRGCKCDPHDLERHLREAFPGVTVYLPGPKQLQREELRQRLISERARGASVGQLARRYGISDRWVRELLNRR